MDQLLVQFQGMSAEYEKAHLAERYRRGKAWRAKTGTVNVLSGAPFGHGSMRSSMVSPAPCNGAPPGSITLATRPARQPVRPELHNMLEDLGGVPG